MLGYPPVILFFEVADCDDPSSTSHGKLGFVGRPSHARCSSVDSQQYQSRLPTSLWGGLPDVCISVLRAGDNPTGRGSDVDASDCFVVTAKFVLEGELVGGGGVELDIGVPRDGESAAVGGEGVVGNGRVEEVVHLGRSHYRIDRRGGLSTVDVVVVGGEEEDLPGGGDDGEVGLDGLTCIGLSASGDVDQRGTWSLEVPPLHFSRFINHINTSQYHNSRLQSQPLTTWRRP